MAQLPAHSDYMGCADKLRLLHGVPNSVRDKVKKDGSALAIQEITNEKPRIITKVPQDVVDQMDWRGEISG